MNTRAASAFGAVLSLALVGVGPSRALSLRSSAAESFLGDVAPGASVVYSRATGSRLRVENSGSDHARIEFKAVPPARAELRDGFEPWPYPERVRLSLARAELAPGSGAETDLTVAVPKDPALAGGLYEIDVVATGFDRAGTSLPLKTRVLLSVGTPLPSAGAPAGGFTDRPGFELSPPSAMIAGKPGDRGDVVPGGDATLKLVNAGDEDLKVTLSPVREWDDDVQIEGGAELAPNPRWLRLDPEVVTVRAGAIGRARVWTEVPRQARYGGRRMAFIVAADAESHGRRTRRYYVLYLNLDRTEEEKRAP